MKKGVAHRTKGRLLTAEGELDDELDEEAEEEETIGDYNYLHTGIRHIED